MTQPAGIRLTEMLVGSSNDSVVRIVRRKGRLKLRLDQARPGDVTLAHEGRAVLTMNTKISSELALRTLIVRARSTGPRLTLKAT